MDSHPIIRWELRPIRYASLGIIASSLQVDGGCVLAAVDENVARKEVAMSELHWYVHRKVAE